MEPLVRKIMCDIVSAPTFPAAPLPTRYSTSRVAFGSGTRPSSPLPKRTWARSYQFRQRSDDPAIAREQVAPGDHSSTRLSSGLSRSLSAALLCRSINLMHGNPSRGCWRNDVLAGPVFFRLRSRSPSPLAPNISSIALLRSLSARSHWRTRSRSSSPARFST